MVWALANCNEQTASYPTPNLQHANTINSLPPVDASSLLLVPNDQTLSSPMVTVRVAAASEIGDPVHVASYRHFKNLDAMALN